MSTRAKLVVLELVAGLFGWGWMIAGGFAIYYLVMAIGFNGDWTSFIVAFVISGVAKWLARSFGDSKQRVAFEAEMVANGMSREEAGEAWLKAYNRQNSPEPAIAASPASTMNEENRRKADERAVILADFRAYIEQQPSIGKIFDVKCLPHDKQIILDAICLEIVGEDDEKKSGLMKACAVMLADFQEGVGDTPLLLLGVDTTSFDTSSMSHGNIRALADQIANNPERNLYEKFRPLVEEDRVNILAKVAASELMHQQMPDEQ